MMVSPLRLDPSRTTLLRKKFESEMATRFNLLKRDIIALIELEDAFGLKPLPSPTFNYDPLQKRDEKGRWTRTAGVDFTQEVYHGTTGKSAKAFMEGRDLPESERSRTLSEFGSGVIYSSEPKAPHQALMFSEGKSEKGARTLIALKLKNDAQILDLSVDMARRPMVGSSDQPVLLIKSKPGFTEDMGAWLGERRAARGLPSLDPERVKVATDPTHPSFDVKEYAGLLPSYAKDRGYAALRLSDETLIVDRSAIVGARKVSSKEKATLKAQVAATRSLRKQDHLYTDEPGIEYPDLPTANELLANQRFRFRTSDAKLLAFQEWLKLQIDRDILDKTAQGDVWLQSYINASYRKGLERAYTDQKRRGKATAPSKEQLAFYAGSKQEFMASAFNRPASVERVKLLGSRALNDLKGVIETMATQMSRELVDGMIMGKSPREVARNINNRVDKIGKSRALTIARTETLRAHNEGALDSFEMMGVEEVGVMVEWDTADDGRVCPLCRPLDGVVLKVKEARGMFPRHPNCRCVPIPANVGEDTKGQKRTKARIQAAIKASVGAERPKSRKKRRSINTQMRRSRWAGAGKRIAKQRPKAIV